MATQTRITVAICLFLSFILMQGAKSVHSQPTISELEARIAALEGKLISASCFRMDEHAERLDRVEREITQLKPELCKFDFENGIHHWKKTGTAFDNQPTYCDNPTARNRGQPAKQQGDWWIGGYEDRPSPAATPGGTQGDVPKGTLTSPVFVIKGVFISFLIGGGCDINLVRAELVIGDRVVRTATGKCHETMNREQWNVLEFYGQRAVLRLVDDSDGGWGHINFDDMKCHNECQ